MGKFENTKTLEITDVSTANWAMRKIKETNEQAQIYYDSVNQEIESLRNDMEDHKKSVENKNGFLLSALENYFNTLPREETKTQEKTKLAHGTLLRKKSSVKLVPDREALTKANEGTKYVEIKPSLKWNEFKKDLEITGDKVINVATGEVVKEVEIEKTEPVFMIKF